MRFRLRTLMILLAVGPPALDLRSGLSGRIFDIHGERWRMARLACRHWLRIWISRKRSARRIAALADKITRIRD